MTPSENTNTPIKAVYALSAFVIAALAVFLRFYGIHWGLPNSLHSYSYHPDEFLIIGAAYVAVYYGRSINPGFYNYPSLFIYICALGMAVAIGYGLKPTDTDIYLIARVISALMGVGAVAAVYWAGKTLFDSQVGLISSLILCILPIHVQHSHYATVDVASTLLIAIALGFAGLIIKRGSWRDYILAGIAVGFAAGTKYNAVLVVLSVVAAHIIRERTIKNTIVNGKFWAMVGCVAAAFIISTPGSILFYDQFKSGIKYEMWHTSTGHGLVFAGTGNGFIYTFMHSFMYGLGPYLAIVFFLAVIWSIWKRNLAALIVLAFIIPYYIVISHSQVRFARYIIPMTPAISIMCAWFACSLFNSSKQRWVGVVKWTVFAAVLLGTFVYTLSLNFMFIKPSPQDEAARWIFSNIGKGSTIGVMEYPWFYSPPLSKMYGFGTLPQREQAVTATPYNIIVFSDCKVPGCWLQKGRSPKWVVVSDFETKDAERLKDCKSISKGDRMQVDKIISDLSLIKRNYNLKKAFGERQTGLMADLPHDMSYQSPQIEIYELKND